MLAFFSPKKLITFFTLLGLCTSLSAVTLSGTIKDKKNQPLAYANIFIKDSYDGASADANGNYSFTTDETGTIILMCTQLGFIEQQKTLVISGDMKVDFLMEANENEMEVVVISAGTIEASDEKRTTVLKPLDIVTTAGGQGDIYGAVQTLPGSSKVGEQEGLFVRGGTGAETKTVIDGMNVNNPFFTSVPDVASRGRFSPFLFKGTAFSTGGYSAQYGQALSSALILETQDLPERTSSTLAFSSVGVGAGHNHLWDKKGFSVGADVNYTNLAPYFLIVPQLQSYTRKPQFLGGSANFRKTIGATGILKFYGYYNYGDLAMHRPDIDSTNGYESTFALKNSNAYTNLSYRNYFNESWRIDIAASVGFDKNNILAETDTINSESSLSQGRIMLTRSFMTRNKFRVGAEYQYLTDESSYNQYKSVFFDNYTSAFVEADIFLGPKFVSRIGGRVENSSLLAKTNVAPRVSLARKISKYSQVSLAYGDFYQKPANEILYRSTSIGFEKASHYILSFQHVDDSITLRVEAYYKQYDHFVKTFPTIDNSGDGYAKGFDVFWRDKKTFRNVDYWISYTWLDTKRNWRDYPTAVMPTFASTHNASVVIKKFFPKIMTSVGMSYNYSSGRPYYNPNNPVFLADKTYDYHSLNVNASYLTNIFGAFTVIVVSVTNVAGFDQVYGYRYSYDGSRREAIIPPAKRSFFIGMFMSFGTDRSKDVINNNN
ncbi:MAG: TonB-dependent receptor [Bacteroidota bacterium]|nr:TonB-dependent receptor [Bacteroidota bacterium]